jgi:glycosyltransferase involved in cell wall biosynthesis
VKGHEVTFRSVKTVVETIPNARFLIVGDGPRQSELERMVRDLGISEYVIFAGFVDNIPEIYSFSDAAVLSSWSEGLPQSLLQAMASGVPVIATRVGGVPEIVINEETGILVDAGDHEALAEGIVRILRDSTEAVRFTENAKKLVSEEHSLTHMIDRIEELYKELINSKNV